MRRGIKLKEWGNRNDGSSANDFLFAGGCCQR